MVTTSDEQPGAFGLDEVDEGDVLEQPVLAIENASIATGAARKIICMGDDRASRVPGAKSLVL